MKTSILVSGIALVLTMSTQVNAFSGGHMKNCDAEKRTTTLLEKLDINQDGQITLDEAQAAKAEKFASIDTDQSGSLSKAEIQAHMQQKQTEMQQSMREGYGKRGGMRMGKHYMRMDSNGDGEITQEEFTSRVPLFDRADADQNGIVTQEEIAQMPCGHGRGRGHGMRNQ